MNCATCGEVWADDDQFCEACGAPRDPAGLTGATAEPVGVQAGVTAGDRCADCQADFDHDGFCQNCGKRRPQPRDHQETDLGWAAAVTDRGLRHRINEDAYALMAAGGRVAVVVCDGVSTSCSAAIVSEVAAHAAIEVLERHLDAPQRWRAALSQAVAAAQRASAEVSSDASQGFDSPPATTIVMALAEPGRAMLANVGDSRAYVVHDAQHANMVTTDDSLAAQAVLEGVPAEVAYQAPGAHQITAWLGRDARTVTPHLSEVALGSDAILILCSDGVWNYAEAPVDLAAAAAPLDGSALALAQRLVVFGLAAGGGDNLTGAVLRPGRFTTADLVQQEPKPDA